MYDGVTSGNASSCKKKAVDKSFTESLAKLEHLQTFNCFGVVAGMERIKLSQNRDSLLLVFRESKVSLVEYDPFNHELKTLALRSLEKDEYKVRNFNK